MFLFMDMALLRRDGGTKMEYALTGSVGFDWKRDYRGNLEWLPERTVLLTIHGSRAYGLATETSDVDIKGIAVPPKEYFHGFLRRSDQAESKNPDMTIYDVRKFFQLAADCTQILFKFFGPLARIK